MHKTDLLPMVGGYTRRNCPGKPIEKMVARKKVTLINHLNPNWRDLGADVLQDS
jgi:hypothetical protein